MENPIVTRILHSRQEKISLQSSRPPDCNFPIFGIPWQLNEHDRGTLSIQETEFLGNHLQLVELIVSEETALELHIQKPNFFLVVVLEGFFKYYQGENLSFYGIGNSMYMIYTPQSILQIDFINAWVLSGLDYAREMAFSKSAGLARPVVGLQLIKTR